MHKIRGNTVCSGCVIALQEVRWCDDDRSHFVEQRDDWVEGLHEHLHLDAGLRHLDPRRPARLLVALANERGVSAKATPAPTNGTTR